MVTRAQRQRNSGEYGGRGAAGELGFGMAHGVEIALPHQHAIVRPDQHGPERVMPMRRRLARDGVGGSEVGEHLVAGHGTILSRCGEGRVARCGTRSAFSAPSALISSIYCPNATSKVPKGP